MHSDEDLSELIENAIKRDDRIYLQPIRISVKDRIVTLEGTVQSYRRKRIAHEVASSFHDCRDVINKLTVDPEIRLPDEHVADYIVSSLNACADITENAVSVSVNKGIATLGGAVRSQWERLVAEDIARSVRGIREVENCLTIDPMAVIDQEALAKEIKMALEHARDLHGTDIEVKISGTSVVLLGMVSLLSQKEMAERVVRRFGFQDVRNEILVKF